MSSSAAEQPRRMAVVIHGGAWKIPQSETDASVNGVRAAARAAMDVLTGPGPRNTAMDAVEAAVRVMEDDAVFDAGRGSCLTAAGTVEMDAMVMRGDTLATGAVAGLASTKNPVSAARKVMEETTHCMLVGRGADAFAVAQGLPQVATNELITERMFADYEQYKRYGGVGDGVIGAFFSAPDEKPTKKNGAEALAAHEQHDTVGAVAVDGTGLVACATSTGGITAKMVGRVGDSPLCGSGGYADNELGAASTTGHGESILKVNLAKRVCDTAARLRAEDPSGAKGSAMQRAVDEGLAYMRRRVGGCGGVVAVGPDGDVGYGFSTERMPWAVCIFDGTPESAARIESGIDPAA